MGWGKKVGKDTARVRIFSGDYFSGKKTRNSWGVGAYSLPKMIARRKFYRQLKISGGRRNITRLVATGYCLRGVAKFHFKWR
jgi:hypothetical protein